MEGGEMDNVEQLLEELRAEGYKTGRFEAQLRAQINMGLTPFKIKYEIAFGEELMRCVLVISKGEEANALYHLTEVTATHRDPVDIDEQVFKGINTRKLDTDMSRVDWNDYFFGVGKSNDHASQAFTGSIIARLVKLAGTKNAAAQFAQQQLMYKHWPEDGFEQYRMSDIANFRAAHEHTYIFSAVRGESLNANLIFMVISEKYERLRYMLEPLEPRDYGIDIDYELRTYLSQGTEGFTITGTRNNQTGYLQLTIPVTHSNGIYSVEPYELTLTPYPTLQHGVYNGIDTGRLEDAMRSVDWKNDHELFSYSNDGPPELVPKIASIQEKLHYLNQDIAGGYLAGILRLKYMQEATFFEDSIDQSVWNLLERLPKFQKVFPAETGTEMAVNLLSGRAVSMHLWSVSPDNTGRWIRLNLDDPENNYPTTHAGNFTAEQIFQQMDNTLLAGQDRESLCFQLMKGNLVPWDVNSEKTGFVVANPERQTLDFSTPDGRAIPINITLDPDWKPPVPEQKSEKSIQRIAPKIKAAKAIKKSKGKGI